MPLVMVELRGEGGDPRPFTAVKAGANDSAAFSFSMYGDCVLRTGNCRTADILLLSVDNGLEDCLVPSPLESLQMLSTRTVDRTAARSGAARGQIFPSLQMVHAPLSDVSLGGCSGYQVPERPWCVETQWKVVLRLWHDEQIW
jgi:hypothetical protein